MSEMAKNIIFLMPNVDEPNTAFILNTKDLRMIGKNKLKAKMFIFFNVFFVNIIYFNPLPSGLR